MAEWRPQRANEIDRKLRDDFRRVLRESTGGTATATDPILAVLFRSFAARVADVYEQAAEAIPAALLDEMMAGLHMPERLARPAQAVVQFTLEEGYELFGQGTEMIGEATSRDKLTFALDSALGVSAARIAFVAVYQDGLLRLHRGTDMPKEFEDARPSFEAAPAALGRGPALFIAVEVAEAEHLSNHGFYFEVVAEARDLAAHLRGETWCLIDDEGCIRAEGLLRPRAGNGGVRRLEWMVPDPAAAAAPEDNILPEGFYGERVFIFPDVPPGRRFLSKAPRNMDAPLRQLFQNAGPGLWDRPRAWLRIPLPQELTTAGDDLVRIALHCVTASNVEVLNQTVRFEEGGKSIPVGNAGGQARHLVRPLSIKGERGSEYVDSSAATADAHAGRYRFRAGSLELDPARTSRGVADGYANVRLLLTRGEGGNNVGVGGISTFLRKGAAAAQTLTSLTSATGGTDGESVGDARRRFAELLLTRERVVTHADLEAIVKAYEPKARRVESRPTLARTASGLRRVQQITVTLDADSFALPDVESRIIQRELAARLQARSLLGLDVQVEVVWSLTATRA